MSELLQSLKSDLLDRRFLPVVALLGVALIAAIAYAAIGSRGSSTSTGSAPSTASTGATQVRGAVAISQAPTNSNQAVAETTNGASQQHSGKARDPFKPLPSSKAKSTSSASSSKSASGSSSTSSSSGSRTSGSNTGGSAPTTTPKSSAPAKPKFYIHYHVTAQFGLVPAPIEGAPPQAAQLKTYKDMPLDEPLPGKENPQLVFLGVVLSTGRDAAFALTGEAILHGEATCKPSPTQCQAIELQAGQSETLEVLSPSGQATVYELKLLSIAKSVSSASAARAHAAARGESKAGRELLRRDGALTLPGLRYSAKRGGLVSIASATSLARDRAHIARRRRGR